jgi:hypothetical protein
MHARVVRFTDVTPERIAELGKTIEGGEGPPPGVEASSVHLLHDAAQGTAVVVIQFESEEKMRAADQAFSEMDPGETPGSRASVDLCSVAAEATLD